MFKGRLVNKTQSNTRNELESARYCEWKATLMDILLSIKKQTQKVRTVALPWAPLYLPDQRPCPGEPGALPFTTASSIWCLYLLVLRQGPRRPRDFLLVSCSVLHTIQSIAGELPLALFPKALNAAIKIAFDQNVPLRPLKHGNFVWGNLCMPPISWRAFFCWILNKC